MSPKLIIGVIGAGSATAAGMAKAREVGRLLAERGAVLICGGLGGIMQAAAQGCHDAGGEVVGILPGADAGAANPYVSLPIVTAMGQARNVIIVQTAQALIAIEGEYGTLSEIAVALKLGKPVVQIDSWPQLKTDGQVDTAEEAVSMIFNALKEKSG